MNIVGIDPSLSSTAVSIWTHDRKIKLLNYTNNKENNKWIKKSSDIIDYTFHGFVSNDDFSDLEVEKLTAYDKITDNIIKDIKKYCQLSTMVYIEGFSYSSSSGPLIDLVTFSTLMRYKILHSHALLNVVPPTSLKQFMGEQVYEKDKKKVYRNENGKAAGSFDKKDMMVALLKSGMSHPYIDFLLEHKEEFLTLKNIPKPFDDITDSFILMYNGLILNDILPKRV